MEKKVKSRVWMWMFSLHTHTLYRYYIDSRRHSSISILGFFSCSIKWIGNDNSVDDDGRQAGKQVETTNNPKEKKAKTTTKWWWKEKSRIPSIPMLLWETHTYFFLLLPYNGINDNSFVLFCLSYILVVHVLVRFIFVQWSVFLSLSRFSF